MTEPADAQPLDDQGVDKFLDDVNKEKQNQDAPAPPKDEPKKEDPQKKIAGKYDSQEDLEKGILEVLKKKYDGNLEAAYKEFEKAMGKPPEEEDNGADNDGAEDGDGEPKEDDDDEKKGLKIEKKDKDGEDGDGADQEGFQKFFEEFGEKGALSKESYQELEKMGLTKDVVDTYIAGNQALVEQHNNKVLERVGGREKFDQMVSWAADNLSEQEINDLNKGLESGKLQEMSLAADALAFRYMKANGNPPKNRVKPGSASTGATQGFKSFDELRAAQKDPRYATDRAYRKEVEARLRVSKI